MFARDVLQVTECMAQCEAHRQELQDHASTASGIHRLQQKLVGKKGKPARPKAKQALGMTVDEILDRGWTPDDVARSGATWAQLQARHGTQELVHKLGMTLEHALAARMQPAELCQVQLAVLAHWGADGARIAACGARLEHLQRLRCAPRQLRDALGLDVDGLRAFGLQGAGDLRRLCPAATLSEWVEAMGDPVADVVRTQHDAQAAGFSRDDFDSAQALLSAMNAPQAPQGPLRARPDKVVGTRVGGLLF